ncbi:TetR family transcriptional regulator [Niabella ginsenosidivorans]|uniref:TetR family transcriptional regulator n=1 Tax=Niabella ginsenosidivorans TaxID=1176587 RepID=A0A1A9HYY9_9BACT|nr:TetR/AcrR family transcriptional regulator [Niabella ginsenosidivorans]ANH79642.1 TetR family transcriptional regulator [Niabella ginsenosidivorans]
MDTRSEIIRIGDDLLRERGYNAFSFSDISQRLHIKNASVHYHFPTKTSLGLAIIAKYEQQFRQLRQEMACRAPLEKLDAFLNVYTTAQKENKICLVGALATDLYTVDPQMQQALKRIVRQILGWLMLILKEGKAEGVFVFRAPVRTKALLVITNMIAALQLTRLTGQKDFREIKKTISNDLTNNK